MKFLPNWASAYGLSFEVAFVIEPVKDVILSRTSVISIGIPNVAALSPPAVFLEF